MDNVFEEVKQRVDILRVCDMLGLKLNRSNQCICPFHNEKTPSFSVHPSKGIFYCFGCSKKGDSITLVSEMYNVKPYEAAKIINENLGLGVEFKGKQRNNLLQANKYKQRQKIKDEFAKWENHTLQLLCDYLHLLRKWEKEEPFDSDLFAEAVHNKDYIDFLIDDVFIYGTNQDEIWFWKNGREELERIERRVRLSR